MVTEVIGIDHIYITVSDMTRSEVFYDLVMTELGFRKNSFVLNHAGHIQYYNRQFGYVLRPSNEDTPNYNSYHTGLHHLCFRVQSVEDVYSVAKRFADMGIYCSEPKRYPEYAEDYYAVFFEDPDGIRLEVTNYRKERIERALYWDKIET
ncbi:VOC family protein [Aquirhabdus sp.]|uniref:VOC family protein n=1 Tax=Aquirhabdus sp. TaxID=2824160 RepID=UPI00396CFBA7